MLPSDNRLKAVKYTTIIVSQGYEHITIKWNKVILFSFDGCGQDDIYSALALFDLLLMKRRHPFYCDELRQPHVQQHQDSILISSKYSIIIVLDTDRSWATNLRLRLPMVSPESTIIRQSTRGHHNENLKQSPKRSITAIYGNILNYSSLTTI
jgi:hypothetical protein